MPNQTAPLTPTPLSEAVARLKGLVENAPHYPESADIQLLLDAVAEGREDTGRLDRLEEAVNAEPLLLHVGEPATHGWRGLALRPGTLVRTLREALDSAFPPPPARDVK